MLNIVIPNEVIESDPLYLAAYIYMEALVRYSFSDSTIVTDEILMYYLFGENVTRDQKKKYNNIKPLLFTGDSTIVNKDHYNDISSDYILIDYYDIGKFSDLSPAEIQLYCYMIRSRNYKITVRGKHGVIGHMPHLHFCQLMDISGSTISRYIKHLEKVKLIYVSRCCYIRNTRHNNIYGAYADRAYIDEYVLTCVN